MPVEIHGKAIDLQPFSASSAQHHLVRRVDDGIHRKCGYIPFDNLDFHAYILP